MSVMAQAAESEINKDQKVIPPLLSKPEPTQHLPDASRPAWQPWVAPMCLRAGGSARAVPPRRRSPAVPQVPLTCSHVCFLDDSV